MTNEEIIQRLEEIDDWVCDIYTLNNKYGRVHDGAINKIRDLIEELRSERSE